MDTTKLVVGQDVYVVSNSGKDFLQGKVIEVTPEGVEVLPENCSSCSCHRSGMLFDNEGNNGHDIHDGMDVSGLGPWHIDDVPFAERKKRFF